MHVSGVRSRVSAEEVQPAFARHTKLIHILILIVAVLLAQVPLLYQSDASESSDLPAVVSVESQTSIKIADQIKFQVILDKPISDPIDSDYSLVLLIHAGKQKKDPFASDQCWNPQSPKCENLFVLASNYFTEPVRLNRFVNDGQPTQKPYEEILSPKSFDSVGEEFIYIEKHSKGLIENPERLDCLAPWWIESTYLNRDTWAVVISASCLGLHKLSKSDTFNKFFTTAFVVRDSDVIRSEEDFHLLWHEGDRFSCVLPVMSESGGQIKGKEVCSLSTSWVLDFDCSPFPDADLEVFRGGKWVKNRSVLRGTSEEAANAFPLLNETKCDGNAENPYHYIAEGPVGPKYRVKFFSSKKSESQLVNLKTSSGRVSFKKKRYAGLSENGLTQIPPAPGQQVCVRATTEGYAEDYVLPDQCSDSGGWVLRYCDVHPQSELQVFKDEKWVKVKTTSGSKTKSCKGLELPFQHVHRASDIGQYRVKQFGDRAFAPTFLILKFFVRI